MYPLIEIQTVPIEIQMKVTRAHLEYAKGTAQVEISREKRYNQKKKAWKRPA